MSKLIAPLRKKGMTISYFTQTGWTVKELESSTINGKPLKDVFPSKKYNPLIRSPKLGDWYVVGYNFRKNKMKPTQSQYKIICHLITMDSDIFRNDVIEAAEIFGLTPRHFGAQGWSELHKRDICKELSKAMVSFSGELFMNTPEIHDPELKVRITADELGISQKDATEVLKVVQGPGSSESKWKRAMNYLLDHKYSVAAAIAFLATMIWGVKSGNLQSLSSYGWEGLKSGASALWDYAQLQAKYNALGTALGTGVAGITGAAGRIKDAITNTIYPQYGPKWDEQEQIRALGHTLDEAKQNMLNEVEAVKNSSWGRFMDTSPEEIARQQRKVFGKWLEDPVFQNAIKEKFPLASDKLEQLMVATLNK